MTLRNWQHTIYVTYRGRRVCITGVSETGLDDSRAKAVAILKALDWVCDIEEEYAREPEWPWKCSVLATRENQEEEEKEEEATHATRRGGDTALEAYRAARNDLEHRSDLVGQKLTYVLSNDDVRKRYKCVQMGVKHDSANIILDLSADSPIAAHTAILSLLREIGWDGDEKALWQCRITDREDSFREIQAGGPGRECETHESPCESGYDRSRSSEKMSNALGMAALAVLWLAVTYGAIWMLKAIGLDIGLASLIGIPLGILIWWKMCVALELDKDKG